VAAGAPTDAPAGNVAGLAMSEEAVFADFAARVRLRGAVVAEIGGEFPAGLLAAHGVAAWYSVDPHRPAGTDGVRRVLSERAEDLSLPDDSVDAVFSSNAFQFLDVRRTLAQAVRVLRPGGLLYAHFGPIWSAADGHQLEYVRYRGRDLTFWDDTLLPPYAHLSYRRDELAALLRSGLEPDLADLLVRHVHDDDTVNRLFFEDYVLAALDSGLEWVEVAASGFLDYRIETPSYDPALAHDVPLDELAAQVSRRLGRRTQLGLRDVLMVLRRPTPAPTPGDA
jgi:SAM-dependent methyltransferase